MNWPEEVDILSPSDLCHGKLRIGQKSCTLGWVERTFPERFYSKVESTIEIVMEKVDPNSNFLNDWMPISNWNDSHTLKECAKAWNLAMHKLGYTGRQPSMIDLFVVFSVFFFWAMLFVFSTQQLSFGKRLKNLEDQGGRR